jgi:hypothetical protein
MKRTISGAMGAVICTAAFAMITGQPTSAAQSQPAASSPAPTSSSQQPPSSAQTPTSRTASDQQVTVTGCIQREADYRRSTAAGRGGAAGTGVGTGNEFVLANATMSPAGAAATSGANPPAATGTAGSNRAYELTGSKEGDAAAHVGKRVEITGKMKASDAAGGPTASVPGSQDLKLPELEVSSIRETTGTCTATP